jgi:hypothetical protein
MIRIPLKLDASVIDIKAAAEEYMDGSQPINSACSLEIEIRFPIPEEWDRREKNMAWAGMIHPTNDISLPAIEALVTMGITGIVIQDDRQICQVIKSKSYSNAPMVVVTVADMDHG